MSSSTAMETSSTEFEPGPGFWSCLDTAGQVDLKLPAFLHTIGHFGVRIDEARMWGRSCLGRVRLAGVSPRDPPLELSSRSSWLLRGLAVENKNLCIPSWIFVILCWKEIASLPPDLISFLISEHYS